MTLKKVYKRVRTAIIYEIICLTTGERYIGSTITKLNVRIFTHKNNLNCSSKIIINRNNYKVNKLETFKTRFELAILLKEQYYIDNTENINKIRALTLKRQKKIQEKDWNKKYRSEHNEKLNQYSRKYRKNNSEKMKEYKLKNFNCECGSIVRLSHKSRHLKSLIHKYYLDSL